MKSAVGIVGAGSFGLALAKLASENSDILLYSRRNEVIESVNNTHSLKNFELPQNIKATSDLEEIADQCELIIPVIASAHFRTVVQALSPYLSPSHMLIHGTKGFDFMDLDYEKELALKDVHTMSDVILQETNVLRVGALTGPNLAKEIMNGQPTATVIASEFDEVMLRGRKALQGSTFFVYGSRDIRAAELAGALKNIVALCSGMIAANNLGKNVQSILITLGLREMMMISEVLGANPKSFTGVAGVGDLVATATSSNSRNYSFGYKLGSGEKFQDILKKQEEVAEGIRSLKVANAVIEKFQLETPIMKSIYNMVYNGKDVQSTIATLMKFPFRMDSDI